MEIFCRRGGVRHHSLTSFHLTFISCLLNIPRIQSTVLCASDAVMNKRGQIREAAVGNWKEDPLGIIEPLNSGGSHQIYLISHIYCSLWMWLLQLVSPCSSLRVSITKLFFNHFVASGWHQNYFSNPENPHHVLIHSLCDSV